MSGRAPVIFFKKWSSIDDRLVLGSTHHLPFGHVIFKLVLGPLPLEIRSDEIYFFMYSVLLPVKSHTIERNTAQATVSEDLSAPRSEVLPFPRVQRLAGNTAKSQRSRRLLDGEIKAY